MSELFKAKWKWTEDESKAGSRRGHKAAEGAALGASAGGGFLMGRPIGERLAERSFQNSSAAHTGAGKQSVGSALKSAAKTKTFKTGAAIATAGVVGSAVNQHAAKKKGVIVRKNADELFVATWADNISKGRLVSAKNPFGGGIRRTQLKQLVGPYKGGVQQNSKSGVAGRVQGAKDKRAGAMAPYKGFNPKRG